MKNIKYIGCFFDYETVYQKARETEENRLYRCIKHPHVTFEYRPQYVPYELFGSEITVKVVGYGCDGENEAFLVEFEGLSGEICELAASIKIPHITLSVSKHGQSVNSYKLEFEPITPFTLTGIFGGMDEEGEVHFSA